jgi:hypothetical protein
MNDSDSALQPATQPPDLRIIPVGKLLSHELHDKQRAAPLIRHLRHDGVIKNPPVVTPLLSSDYFMVLDGANRIVALDVLGIPYAPVQVVPYGPPSIELHTWFHVVCRTNPTALAERLNTLPGIEAEAASLPHARALLAARARLLYYILPDGSVTVLAGGGLKLEQRTYLLRAIVDTYSDMGRLNRASTDDISMLTAQFPDLAMAVIFPRYDPAELLDLTHRGVRVPPGITRHIIHGRALRINYPLEKLQDTVTSLEEKNQELVDWVRHRFEARGVRYYAESVYLFDE